MGPQDLPDLGALFDTSRNTRRCWCMAFCTTRSRFAGGWLTGGNRRRFEAMAAEATPVGVLATSAGEPVGWCACGPRSRYLDAPNASSSLLRRRDPAEDQRVWLVPCLFVREGSRGRGVTHALLRAAVELARGHGAQAVEGWPLAATVQSSVDAFLGREQVFTELGFRCVERPTPQRAVMRLELARPDAEVPGAGV